MENEKKSSFMHSINFGLITGVVLILISLIFYSLFDFEAQKKLGWISFIFFIAGIIYATFKYRDNQLGGYISYSNAFVSCLYVALIASFVLSVYNYLFLEFFDAAMIDKSLELAEEKILEKMPNIEDAELEKILSMQEKFINPIIMAISNFFTFFIIGIVGGLIGSIFIKKEEEVSEVV